MGQSQAAFLSYSDICVNLVATYMLECVSEHFNKTHMQFKKKTYRDDGLVIFEGDLKAGYVANWLD